MNDPATAWLAGRTISHCGAAGLVRTDAGLRFVDAPAAAGYSNAQVDDTHGLARRALRWQPSERETVRLAVRARFSAGAQDLRGTAGFGFWNDPFAMSESRAPALPRAVWFFLASPQSNLPLAQGVAGWGWKAALIDAGRPPAPCLLPAALPGALLLRVPRLHARLWPIAQKLLGIAEAPLAVEPTAWHTYALEWGPARTRFQVDGVPVLEGPSPRGPLGLVVWMDNQWMVATPQGRFGSGVARVEQAQWLEIGALEVTRTT